MFAPKDGVPGNTHYLNALAVGATATTDRIPLYEVYMRMAEELAKRSTCVRCNQDGERDGDRHNLKHRDAGTQEFDRQAEAGP